MKKNIIASAAILAALLFMTAGCAEKEQATPKLVAEQTGNIKVEMPSRGFTAEEVTGHSSKEDCWIIINKKVYDATAFVSSHPGGAAILNGCGKDATSMVEAKPAHGTDKFGSKLSELYIGEVI